MAVFDGAVFDAVIFDTGATTQPAAAKPARRRRPQVYTSSPYIPEPSVLSGFLTLPPLTITGTLTVTETEEWLLGLVAL